MLREKGNPFISRMTDHKNNAMKGSHRQIPCAQEIRPMIEAFFKKTMNAQVKWDGSDVCWHIDDIAEIVKHIAMNTRNYEKLSDEDVASLRKIFDEINVLYTEALELNSHPEYSDDLSSKIGCIDKIVCQNMSDMHDSEEEHENYRDGMIFQDYEDLWKVIHRVNTEWTQLCNRGFSLNVLCDYWNSVKYDRAVGLEKTEEEKLENFMALLDGKMKFVPIYEHRFLCFKVVDNDFEDEIIHAFEKRYTKPYRLRQEGEEITQCGN